MKISERKITNFLVAIIILGILSLGWFTFPLIAKNNFIRIIFYIVCLSIPILYFVNLVAINYKSGLFSFLAAVVVGFILSFSFSGIYYGLDFNNEITWFYIFILFLLNFTVLIHDSFEKDTANINKSLVTIWDYIIWGGIILAGLMLFKLINGSVIPPWNDLSIERKTFYLFRIFYFFIITSIGIKLKSKNKIGGSISPIMISLITLLFIIYLSCTLYLKSTSNYFIDNFDGLTKEILTYLGISFLLIYTIQILNSKSKSDFHKSTVKVYRFGLLIFAVMLIVPWFVLLLSEYLEVLKRFFSSKQESLIVIIISSVSISVVSNLILKYYISKEKENK